MANFCAPPGVPLGEKTGYFPEGGAGGPLSVGRMTIKTKERKDVGLEFYKFSNSELWLRSTNDRVVRIAGEKIFNDIEKIYTLQAGDLVEKVTIEAGLDQSAWIRLEVMVMMDRTPDKLTKAEVLALMRQTKTLNEFKLQLGLGPVTDEALAKFVINKGVTIRDFRAPAPSDKIEKRDGVIKELHEPHDRRRRTIYVRDALNPLHKEVYEEWWTAEEAEQEWIRLSAEQNAEAWQALASEMVRTGAIRRANESLLREPGRRPGVVIVGEPASTGITTSTGITIRPYVNWGGVDTGSGKGATPTEIALGEWLDRLAQSGRLPGVGRVRGMGTNKNSAEMGKSSGRAGDYNFLPVGTTDANFRSGNELRADAIIPKWEPPNQTGQNRTTNPNRKFENLMAEGYGKVGSQADVVLIELGGGNSSIVTDEVVNSWSHQDIFGTSPGLKRLIVVRNIGGMRTIVRDVSR